MLQSGKKIQSDLFLSSHSGGKFINSDNYQCNFQGDFYSAIWNSFDSLTCLNLTSVSMTTARLSVYLDGNIYSNSLLFYDFYGI